MSVLIETTVGDIVVDLYVKERPRCCMNFIKLCKVKYFNFSLFHSVQRNFVAQTGDPTGTGKGGSSIYQRLYGDQARYFEAEKLPKIKHTKIGQLSMVNDGKDFHGSQFLFTLRENLDSLDEIHTVFGEIVEGEEVLMKINDSHCDGENRPYQDIRITHTIIVDDPLDDPKGLEIPDASPERPSEEEVVGFRIGADEVINPDEDVNPEELKKKEEKADAKHSAQLLEIIGDLPDMDVKPPDNVLFVCKLNAITTSEDLEIIFSRFGQINSCEIITDFKTGASLQYAFIEFETADMCEKAYSKMDNVLIDDRRIHVDFSQSVSKVKYPQFWKRMKDTNKGGVPSQNDEQERQKKSKKTHDHERRRTEEDRRKKRRSRSHDLDHSDKNGRKQHKDYEVRGGKHSKSLRGGQSRDKDERDDRHGNNHHKHSSSHYRRDEERSKSHHHSKSSTSYSSRHREDLHKGSVSNKKKKEKSSKKRRYSASSNDESSSASSYESEVRCGKHRKREHERRK